MSNKKKILIMAPLFYPQKNGGGPIVSSINLVRSIKDRFDVYVIANNFELGEKEPLVGVSEGWNTFDFGKVYYVSYQNNNFRFIYNIIKEIKPDVVYQNSFFSHQTAVAALLYNKRHKVKTILAPRGELCVNALNMKKDKKKIYIGVIKLFGLLKNLYYHTTGDEETRDVKNLLNVDDVHSFNIQNITLPGKESYEILHKEPGELRMVFTARIQKKKNLLFAIESLKNIKGNVTFDIYGPIEGDEYWNQCRAAIKELPGNIKVKHCGKVEQKEIPDTLEKYHLFYMPTLSENYGHSIVEAFLASRPVIISDQTPWLNLESHNCGYSLPLSEVEGFEKAVQSFVDMDNDEYAKKCSDAKKYITTMLDTEKIVNQYIDMFGGETHEN